MFSRSRRRRSTQDKPGAVDERDPGTPETPLRDTPETPLRHTQQFHEWRRAAQRVTRAWNAWLAADSHNRAIRYRIFAAALADEERTAAELEHVSGLRQAGNDVATIAAQVGRLGAR